MAESNELKAILASAQTEIDNGVTSTLHAKIKLEDALNLLTTVDTMGLLDQITALHEMISNLNKVRNGYGRLLLGLERYVGRL